ncbi:ribonuclease HII [Vagococcus penaei]|uniref:Ribonuclease HII n=1 Tax=Vagococcus penaei TaxID=633807 RepID=A0A1Q2D3P8_9ENTE|nr:ribonuclease HII [Vagococcus penaei]AQP52972.1 ribonuclease HII [Vagococcus penaei]RSU02568.1 ribonuclease HII [Vagococcus penaei]
MSKETVQEIKKQLEIVTTLQDDLLRHYQQDDRKGVQNAIKATIRRLEKQEALRQHFDDMSVFENKARMEGYQVIAGIDEVGRGPLAGPVVACAIVLPMNFDLIEVNDSKQLSGKKRDELYDKILSVALAVGIGMKDEHVIDRVNIYEATKLAMLEAVDNLSLTPDKLLIDAMTLPVPISQEKIIKGDARSLSIACASIVAKVTRDRMMAAYDEQYPGYGFAKNAGYGTKEHLDGLNQLGICPIHRQSFAPIKDMI